MNNRQDYIIRQALNESINEFILQEAGLWDGVKAAGQFAWNGVKAYMDKATNGEWNRKFGQYVNGNGKGTELFYLGKWFSYHLRWLQYSMQRYYSPSDWHSKNDGPSEYIKKYCTYDNFDSYLMKFFKGGKLEKRVTNINNYIYYNITTQPFNTAIKNMSTNKFLSSEYGKYYLANKEAPNAKQTEQPGDAPNQATGKEATNAQKTEQPNNASMNNFNGYAYNNATGTVINPQYSYQTTTAQPSNMSNQKNIKSKQKTSKR